MRGRVRTLVWVSLVTLLGACAQQPAPPTVEGADAPSGTASEPPGDGEQGAADRVWFEVLGVSQEAPDTGSIELAQDAAAPAELWDRYTMAGAPAQVDFAQHVVVFYARAEDACPDELVALTWQDAILEATWVPPPGGCNQPLIATGYAVQLHRADLGTTPTLALRQHPGHGGDVERTFELPDYDGPGAPPAPTVDQQPTEAEIAALFPDGPLQQCKDVADPSQQPIEVDGPRSDDPERQSDDIGSDLQAYGAEHADTFGFLFISQSRGGQWTLGFTADVEAHRQRLAQRFPDANLAVLDAPFTQAELERAAAPLQDAMGGDLGLSHLAVGLTRVNVGVIDPSRDVLERIAAMTEVDKVCIDAEFSGTPQTNP